MLFFPPCAVKSELLCLSNAVHRHLNWLYLNRSRPRSAMLRRSFCGTVEHGHIVWLPADSVPILYNSPGRWPLWEWNGSWNAIFFVSFVVLEKNNLSFTISVTNHFSYTLIFLFLLIWDMEFIRGDIFVLEGHMGLFRSEGWPGERRFENTVVQKSGIISTVCDHNMITKDLVVLRLFRV